MDAVNDALKFVVQAKKLLSELCISLPTQKDDIDRMIELLEKAEEALVK